MSSHDERAEFGVRSAEWLHQIPHAAFRIPNGEVL